MRYRSLWLIVALLCFGSACCCQTPGTQTPATISENSSRIIIAFDETLTAPDDPELMTSLARDLGCKPQLQQAVGTHTYVYHCINIETEEILIKKLSRLGLRKDVRYAELDRKRQTAE